MSWCFSLLVLNQIYDESNKEVFVFLKKTHVQFKGSAIFSPIAVVYFDEGGWKEPITAEAAGTAW